MPTPPTSDLPRPKSWDEFEDIVWEIYTEKWKDSYAQRYGRSGQAQNGIDIYGQQSNSDCYIGVQCKRYENGKLHLREIEKEIAKAECFSSPLSEYIIATTVSRDTKIQDSLRLLNESRGSQNKFFVRVVFWEDICAFLTESPRLLNKYYSDWERVFTATATPLVKEIAQTLASRLEQHWNYMNYLQQMFIGFLSKPYELSADLKAQTLGLNLNQLQDDEIYRTARLRVGVLPRKALDYISIYDINISMLLNVLEKAVSNPSSLENISALQRLCMQIIYTRIDCVLTLAVLNREILDDTERFLQCKDYLRSEYERAREALVSGEKFPKVIFSTLEGVEIFFKDLEATDEINPLIIRSEIN